MSVLFFENIPDTVPCILCNCSCSKQNLTEYYFAFVLCKEYVCYNHAPYKVYTYVYELQKANNAYKFVCVRFQSDTINLVYYFSTPKFVDVYEHNVNIMNKLDTLIAEDVLTKPIEIIRLYKVLS